jgi:hypothetical protein
MPLTGARNTGGTAVELAGVAVNVKLAPVTLLNTT